MTDRECRAYVFNVALKNREYHDPRTNKLDVLPEFLPLLARQATGSHEGDPDAVKLRQVMNAALVRWSGAGPAVAATRDTTVRGPYRDIPVRVYEPFAGHEPRPVIVFTHGSGFVLGGLETHDGLARRLALATGAIVVSVDYLLAPEHPFPAAPEEVFAVLGWVRAGGAGDRADPDRVGLAGDSAGGAITLGVAAMARDRGAPMPAALLLIYPTCDSGLTTPSWERFGRGYFLETAVMCWFWAQYLGGTDPAPYSVPLVGQEFTGFPATVVVGAGCDPLLDEGRLLAARLRAGGSQVCGLTCDGAIHGFMTMFDVTPAAATAVRMAGAAFLDLAGWAESPTSEPGRAAEASAGGRKP